MKIKKTIELPEEVLLSLRTDENEFIDEMKKTMAVKYYANKKLSIGQSAELADMSEEDFIKLIGKEKISIFRFDNIEDELKEDIQNA
jgi:predicted HTH domain antitoxin